MNDGSGSPLSGKNAHARPNMKSGRTIQLATKEKTMCFHRPFCRKSATSASGETRARIGTIIRMRAMTNGTETSAHLTASKTGAAFEKLPTINPRKTERGVSQPLEKLSIEKVTYPVPWLK